MLKLRDCCLLWIVQTRAKDKNYIWISVWWKAKNWSWGIYTSRMHSVVCGTGTPKDRDEVNRRDACEWDGWVCVRDVIGAPSIFKLTHRTAVLTRVLPTFTLSYKRKAARLKVKIPPLVCWGGWTPEAVKNRSVSLWVWKNSNLNHVCLLWIVEARAKDKNYIWISVWWKDKN